MITEKQVKAAIREASAVRSSIELKDPGERGAGRFTLIIRPMKSRIAAEWYSIWYRDGRRTKAKLGSYPTMTVAEAREKFRTEYARAGVGRNRQASTGTVEALFQAYVDSLRRDGKRSADIAEYILLSPKSGAAKAIGANRLAADIMPGDITPHLAAIHDRGAGAHANAALAYIAAAFNFGLKAEHDFTNQGASVTWGLKFNPAAAIRPAGGRRAGDRFLSPKEFRTVWLWLESYQGRSMLAAALLLKLATGQRSEEILRINDARYDRATAIVSWETTKTGVPHSIPLPRQAVPILNRLPANSCGLFFPNRSNPALPANYHGLHNVIGKFLSEHPNFEHFTARDLRRTFKTLAGDAGISKDMRDRLQNHAEAGVSAKHYDRYDYLDEKREAMARWSAYLDLVIAGTIDQVGMRAGNVVQLAAAASAAP
jgi:integrase